MRPAFPFLIAVLAVSAPQAQDPGSSAPGRGNDRSASRLSRLQGRAAIDRRTHVVGATVLVQAMESPARLYLTSSGESGIFLVDGLPDGEYRVSVARDGLAPVAKDRVNVRFPFRAVVEVKMEPAPAVPAARPAAAHDETPEARLALRGRVRERDGAPLAEVRLRLVRADGVEDPRSRRTDEGGRFEFDDLGAGEWRLEVEGVGFLPIRRSIVFRGDTELEISLVRQPGDYEPSPLELMPPERPVPPEGLADPFRQVPTPDRRTAK